MTRLTRRSVLTGSVALAAAGALNLTPGSRQVSAQSEIVYDLVDFGPLDQAVFLPNGSRPIYGGLTGIATSGDTFGKVAVSTERLSPASWSPEGKLKRYKSSTYGGVINGLNTGGDAVGQLFTGINGGEYNTVNKAGAWLNGDMVELPLPDPAFAGGEQAGNTTGISDDGVIVGSGNGYVLRWVNGSPEILKAPDQTSVSGIRVNSKGAIASSIVSYQETNSKGRVARFDGSTFIPIDPPAGTESFSHNAVAINGEGAILASVYAVDVFIGIVYGADTVTLFDQRSTGGTFAPIAFNDKNEVIGSWQARVIDRGTPAVWRDAGPLDLRTQIPAASGLFLYQVQGINNDGIICGLAYDADNVAHPVLLTPA